MSKEKNPVDPSELEDDELQFPITVPLRRPLKHGKKEITELELDELTAGSLEKIGGGEDLTIRDVNALIADSSGLPPSVIRQLRPHDLALCVKWVKRFLRPLQSEEKSDEE